MPKSASGKLYSEFRSGDPVDEAWAAWHERGQGYYPIDCWRAAVRWAQTQSALTPADFRQEVQALETQVADLQRRLTEWKTLIEACTAGSTMEDV